MSSLSLSMIVRDAEPFLAECLRSVRGVVDEIVITDTGSRDRTIDIARDFGARITTIAWNNDFAEARNCALDEVRTDWILSLDADERLDPAAKIELPKLLRAKNVAGYRVEIRNYVLSLTERLWDQAAKPNRSALPELSSYPAYVEHENVRLFRRAPEIRFVGRVHESVGPGLQQRGQKIAEASFLIHHLGMAADETTRARKNQLYRELGQLKIREMPNNAQAYLELGLVEMDNFGDLERAQELYEQATKIDPGFALPWFFRGVALLKLARNAEALRSLDQAERLRHRTALVAEFRGDAFYNLCQYASAREAYATALRRDPQNVGIESKLGLATTRAGNTAAGLQTIRNAVAKSPSSPELHDRLVTTAVWLGHLEEAAEASEVKLAAIATPQPGDFLRAASLRAKLKQWPRAAALLDAGLRDHPGNSSLHAGLAEIADTLSKAQQVVFQQ